MIFTRELLNQWNQSPYTVDRLMALSDGMMSLERHAFLSSWMPLFYVSISVCVVSTFMLNWKQITSKNILHGEKSWSHLLAKSAIKSVQSPSTILWHNTMWVLTCHLYSFLNAKHQNPQMFQDPPSPTHLCISCQWIPGIPANCCPKGWSQVKQTKQKKTPKPLNVFHHTWNGTHTGIPQRLRIQVSLKR